jgi:hypothetical protein
MLQIKKSGFKTVKLDEKEVISPAENLSLF